MKIDKNLKILIAIAFVIGIAIAVYTANLQQTVEETIQSGEIISPQEKTILNINFGKGEVKQFELEIKEGKTVLDFLKEKTQQSGLNLQTKTYNMRVLVEAIGEKENGEDNKYWIYYVNDETPMVSVDKKEINPGDKIEFKFQESIF